MAGILKVEGGIIEEHQEGKHKEKAAVAQVKNRYSFRVLSQ
jgi:hypothetical protein